MSLTTRIVRKHFVQESDGTFRHECNDWEEFKPWQKVIEDNAKWAQLAGNEVIKNDLVPFFPFNDAPFIEFRVELVFRTRPEAPLRMIQFLLVREDEYIGF